MEDEDLDITPEEEEKALRECVRLGYMKLDPNGKPVITDVGIRRMMGMVWAHSQRRRREREDGAGKL